MGPSTRRVKWYKSLSFLGLLGLSLIPLWDMAGIFIIMQTRGRDLVVEESARLIEESGNTAIAEIGIRSRQIGALARSLATMGAALPRDPALFQRVLPRVIDFNGDRDVAGGGIWPEPGAFTPGVERRSFFYGRDAQGALRYFDDYNHGRGYHKDEWYPVVKYSRPGECFWSESYMDPYSYQPMVTCTAAMHSADRFIGVSTIDLKLEGLHDFMEKIRVRTGGYVFLLDRNNKFLTFPFPDRVRLVGVDDKGARTEEFMSAAQLAQKEPTFQPIAAALQAMNREALRLAARSPDFQPETAARLTQDSDQITKEEAELIAAVITDPFRKLRTERQGSNLYARFRIPDDFITREESLVFIFNVPNSYWKVVAVKPMSEAQAVAGKISKVIITLISITILVGIVIAAALMHYAFTRPIKATTLAVEEVGELVARKQFSQLENYRIASPGDNELGRLADVINSLGSELQTSYSSLLELNATLEKKVAERTDEIQQNLSRIQELKYQQDGDYFLTAQLLKPLSGNYCVSDSVRLDYYVKQKKSFEFKQWRSDIGGDLCIAHSLLLRGRPSTVFMNADAMGKSIQGAGGILVLGSIFGANIERTKLSSAIQSLSPERWLKNAFLELQKVFESFNGSMLVSVCLGMIDDDSGAVYFINAEHPPMALYRAGQAAFVDQARPLHKLGIVLGGGQLHIQTLRLLPGDALFVGSDGRDDLEIGRDENGGRVINEDETLFLRHIEAGRGELRAVAAEIEKSGELTDDLSLMRIEYSPGGAAAPDAAAAADLKQAREWIDQGNLSAAQQILENLHARDPRAGSAQKSLAKLHYKAGRHAQAAAMAREYLENHPYDTEFLHFASMTLIKIGELTDAADIAERVRMRRPDYIENLERLAKLYERLGNADRAETMRREADAVRASLSGA